jgi:hypothetical protein
MSILNGHFAHATDLLQWLRSAEHAVFSKNRVRKQLWTDFTDIVAYGRSPMSDEFVRIPRSLFVSLQSLCLADGRGDSLSDDQILSFCTLVADLRDRCPVPQDNEERRGSIRVESGTIVRDEASVASQQHE